MKKANQDIRDYAAKKGGVFLGDCNEARRL